MLTMPSGGRAGGSARLYEWLAARKGWRRGGIASRGVRLVRPIGLSAQQSFVTSRNTFAMVLAELSSGRGWSATMPGVRAVCTDRNAAALCAIVPSTLPTAARIVSPISRPGEVRERSRSERPYPIAEKAAGEQPVIVE